MPGVDTGVISGAMLKLKDHFNLDDTQQEMVVSFTVGGAIVVRSSVHPIHFSLPLNYCRDATP